MKHNVFGWLSIGYQLNFEKCWGLDNGKTLTTIQSERRKKFGRLHREFSLAWYWNFRR